MRCPICGGEINEKAKFCGKCGNKVPRCPTCGMLITKRIKFCTKDGTVIPQEILDLLPQPDADVTAEIVAEVAAVLNEPPVQQIIERYDSANTHSPKNYRPSTRRFCVKCGNPCEEGQTICRNCRAMAQNSQGRPVKKRKNKLAVILIILLVLLLLAGIGVGGYFVCTHILFPDHQPSDTLVPDYDTQDEEKEDNDVTNEDEDNDFNEEIVPEKPTAPLDDMPTEAPTEEPTEAATVPVPTYEYYYEVVKSDVSWKEAQSACEAKNGYLATITSREEFEEISKLAEDSGLTYLWVGACLESDSDWSDNTWITGEAWTFENWYPGEPSKVDSDGTREYYLCIWNAKYQGNNIGWTFNDQRNDIVAALPSISGDVGYICEYRIEVSQ